MQTPSEISALPENNAARITVQRITVETSRRKNTCAFEGVGAVAAASDIRAKLAGVMAVANSQLPENLCATICVRLFSNESATRPASQFHRDFWMNLRPQKVPVEFAG